VRFRSAIAWAMITGPALVWIAVVAAMLGPQRGYPWAFAFGIFTGLAVLGLTALFVAYFPWTVERLGFGRFGAWLRRWWDEDAK
jgi:hypothetical protein